jgi:hypothetical protein
MMSKVLSQKRWNVSVRKPKKMQGERGHVIQCVFSANTLSFKVSFQRTLC